MNFSTELIDPFGFLQVPLTIFRFLAKWDNLSAKMQICKSSDKLSRSEFIPDNHLSLWTMAGLGNVGDRLSVG